MVAYQHIEGRQKDFPRSRCSSSLDPHSLSVKWEHTSMLGCHWDSECQRVPGHTVFVAAFLSVCGCTRKGTVSKGYKKPNSIFREQETRKLQSPPSRCAGRASGLLSPLLGGGTCWCWPPEWSLVVLKMLLDLPPILTSHAHQPPSP